MFKIQSFKSYCKRIAKNLKYLSSEIFMLAAVHFYKIVFQITVNCWSVQCTVYTVHCTFVKWVQVSFLQNVHIHCHFQCKNKAHFLFLYVYICYFNFLRSCYIRLTFYMLCFYKLYFYKDNYLSG